MVRITDPLLPRAVFGVLNTVLYFPSGAVYPQQGFPPWMQAIAAVDPFTYAVHAFKSLLLKNTGFEAIAFDLGFLVVFSVVSLARRRCCSGGRCSASGGLDARKPRGSQASSPRPCGGGPRDAGTSARGGTPALCGQGLPARHSP